MGFIKSPINTQYAIETIKVWIRISSEFRDCVFGPNAKYPICWYVIAPVRRAADTKISNENADAIAERVRTTNPTISPLRAIANGSDRTPPPIIVEMRLKDPTMADCCRSAVSNAEGAIHSGDLAAFGIDRPFIMTDD